jgi:hypothetical protein
VQAYSINQRDVSEAGLKADAQIINMPRKKWESFALSEIDNYPGETTHCQLLIDHSHAGLAAQCFRLCAGLGPTAFAGDRRRAMRKCPARTAVNFT